MDYQKESTNTVEAGGYIFVVDTYFDAENSETLAQKLAAVVGEIVRKSIAKPMKARYNNSGKH